jgi:cytochrome P450
MFISRVSKEARTIAGQDVEKGQKVLLGLASANRDESVHPDPTRFSIDRADEPPHLAFGWGAHTCVGAHVVRHLGSTLLNTLLDKVATIQVEVGTTPVPYVSPQGNGFDQLRLRLTAVADTIAAAANSV